jgi:hypothetical protein
MSKLVERNRERIVGELRCLDRVVITGTLPGLCYAEGMQAHLNAQGVLYKDYTQWADPIRASLKESTERLAAEAGAEIIFIRRSTIRKEAEVAEILRTRGQAPGLVVVLSAMERCGTYRPRFNRERGHMELRPDEGRCLHYYFYVIDELLGLIYFRVPTWAPFRAQVYFNGHNWLANQLRAQGQTVRTEDNAIVSVSDWATAQKVADAFDVTALQERLDALAQRFCPFLAELDMHYHWSLMQVEYATDLIFRSVDDLAPLYKALSLAAIHTIGPDDVATFLGKRPVEDPDADLSSRFSVQIQGTRIRHKLGSCTLKMYDKFAFILRIETTTNDVSFFKHRRRVEHKDGRWSFKTAPLKKNIYSLPTLCTLLTEVNQRYLLFLSALDDTSSGQRDLKTVTETATDAGRTYKGFNFFAAKDLAIFSAIARGDTAILGIQNKTLRQVLPNLSSGAISRVLKRLRIHGLLKRVRKSYRYHLTDLGRRVVLAGLKIRDLVITPLLAVSSGPIQA